MSVLDAFKDKNVYAVLDCDLDGIASTAIAEYFIKPLTKDFVRYNTAERSLPDFDMELARAADIVIFVDISPPTLEFYQQIKDYTSVYIFDHHTTARATLGELENYFFAVDKCGAKLLFEYVTQGQRVSKKIAQFIELVDIYDRYVTHSSLWRNAKALNNILYGYVDWRRAKFTSDNVKYNRFIEVQMQKFADNKFNRYYFSQYEVEMAQKAEDKEKKMLAEGKKNLQIRVDDSGNKYGYTECTSKLSWTVTQLLGQYEHLRYIVARSTWEKESLKVSLRSRNDFPINFIAEKWGGGGHPQAAAFAFESREKLIDFKLGKFHLI